MSNGLSAAQVQQYKDMVGTLFQQRYEQLWKFAQQTYGLRGRKMGKLRSFKGKQKRYAKWKLFLSERKQRREAFRRVRSNPESFPLVHGSVAYSIGCHRHV